MAKTRKYRVVSGHHQRWEGGKDGKHVIYGPGDAVELTRVAALDYGRQVEPWTDPMADLDDDEGEAGTPAARMAATIAANPKTTILPAGATVKRQV